MITMNVRRTTTAAAAALALALTTATVGAAGAQTVGADGASGSGAETITIGIKFDQPGVGLKTPDGTYTGFDVDVATYVAKQLGFEPGDIKWKEAKSADRETLLERGDVDFIAASYSINDEREEKVDFAGPYLLAHQDVLMRADDDSIKKPEDLNNKKLCSVTGSTSAQNVKDDIAPQAQLQEYGGYSECLTGLENEIIDALTTDDVILAGYAAQDEFKGKINTALEKMVSDGSWDQYVEKNFGPADYQNEPAPKIGVVVE